MKNKNEENFRNALQRLVREEPQKLAFFDTLEAGYTIPPFTPAPDNKKKSMTGVERKTLFAAQKRRGYNFAMTAAAACAIIFTSFAAINSDHSMSLRLEQLADESVGVMSVDTAPEEAHYSDETTPSPQAQGAPISEEDSANSSAAEDAQTETETEAETNDSVSAEPQNDAGATNAGDANPVEASAPAETPAPASSDATVNMSTDVIVDPAPQSAQPQIDRGISTVILLICAVACAIVFVILLVKRNAPRRKNLR